MKHILSFGKINELAKISKRGKFAYADNKKLRDLSHTELSDNLVLFYLKEETFFTPPGKYYLYMISDPVWKEMYKDGEADLLMFPKVYRFFSDVSPIHDIWKKSHSKNYRGSDFIIAMVEGEVTDGKIYVDMMSVRPKYHRNSINTKMLDALKDRFDGDFVFVDPLDDGLQFIHKYAGEDAKFRWTSTFRPKSFKKLYPDSED